MRKFNLKAYRRRNRLRVNEHGRNVKRFGRQWWLKAAFIKAGGDALDWPNFRKTTNETIH